MLRQPAVSGRFYPSDSTELAALVRSYAPSAASQGQIHARACLVPHAGYLYSGHVAGAVFARLALPEKIVLLGVRHYPRGENAAILSSGAWRTPLGDALIDEELAAKLRSECPLLREDTVAHATEHSLEVQIPFLQVLRPNFRFVPIALGSQRFEELTRVGEGIARALGDTDEEILLLTTSDLNHYEDDATTRIKDSKAIDRIMALDASGLYATCRDEAISMCGLGPTVAMLTALNLWGKTAPELVRYATSADVSGDFSAVVGYAGMIFS
ncbi:MAG TPA: AmmeMemoRadiSam system protein B [Candidatus Acidoferrum sp.]|nr:AmmeMemoRadiSam system protein B [Candidatus Acidoferrum sp.]